MQDTRNQVAEVELVAATEDALAAAAVKLPEVAEGTEEEVPGTSRDYTLVPRVHGKRKLSQVSRLSVVGFVEAVQLAVKPLPAPTSLALDSALGLQGIGEEVGERGRVRILAEGLLK